MALSFARLGRASRVQLYSALGILALIAGLAPPGSGVHAQAAFPTGDESDTRMLSLVCGSSAAAPSPLSVVLAVPAAAPSFDLRIFDGDTGAVDGEGNPHWDAGSLEVVFRLYFDPLARGNTAPEDLVGTWRGNSPNPPVNPDPDPSKAWVTGTPRMGDNGWWMVQVSASDEAKAPSGRRFYHLQAELEGCDGSVFAASNFKIEVGAGASLEVPMAHLEAAFRAGASDAEIIYGIWPPTGPTFFLDTPSTYDGTWSLPFRVQERRTDLRLFEGDAEMGTNETTGSPSQVSFPSCADLDDPDTGDDYTGFPAWLPTVGFNPEGAATGALADDSQLDAFRRGDPGDPANAGCPRLALLDPAGVSYLNDNPSGHGELEQFRLATRLAENPNAADYGPSVSADGETYVETGLLPRGVWSLGISGLDLANNISLYGLRFCGSDAGAPACNPPVFLLAPLVFRDLDGDGQPDPGERRIRRVVLELIRDPAEPPVARTRTGNYGGLDWPACLALGIPTNAGRACFGADRLGPYTVRVASVNFLPGGALRGMVPTTAVEVSGELSADAPTNQIGIVFGFQRGE